VPDYFDGAGWCQQQDLSWFTFVILVLTVRVAVERTGQSAAQLCPSWRRLAASFEISRRRAPVPRVL